MAYLERSRDDGVTKNLDMTKCLMLLSSKNKNRKRSAGFECKTCHREFASFQALGGHRASHKRARLMSDDDKSLRLVTKPKMHECTICGLEFAMGQALGGHMRRHRALLTGHSFPEEFRSCNKRVFELDLNLTPLENDLVVLFGKMPPKVDVFV